jgi:hypothetical protein
MKRLAILFLLGALILAASAADAPPRAALVDFTTDDGIWRSVVAARNVTSLVQAGLQDEKGVEWVERSQLQAAENELNLGSMGFTSGSTAVRLGKWLKADLLLTGRYLRNEKEGHTLLLEVVDLDHADVLAERRLQIDGDRRDMITVDAAVVQQATAALKEAIKEARERLLKVRTQKAIAFLFLRNVDPSPRLNSFGQDFGLALEKTASETGDVRALRFPRADEATGESELVLLGLTDANVDAWQKVANLYVWGSYHELKSAGRAFEQVEVEVTFCLWNGAGQPVQVVEKATVAELPALATRMAQRAIEAVRKLPGAPPSPDARQQAARWLMDRVNEARKTIDSFDTKRKDFLATPEGKGYASYISRTLETACFFAPDDPRIQWDRFSDHSARNASPHANVPFLSGWERANELGDLLRKFPRSTGASWLNREFYVNWFVCLLEAIKDPRRLPPGVTETEVQEWRSALESRFVKESLAYSRLLPERLETYAQQYYGGWIDCAIDNVQDPQKAAQVIEALWPYCRYGYLHRFRKEEAVAATGKKIREFYSKLGRAGQAEEMLDASTTALRRLPLTPAKPVAAQTPSAGPASPSNPYFPGGVSPGGTNATGPFPPGTTWGRPSTKATPTPFDAFPRVNVTTRELRFPRPAPPGLGLPVPVQYGRPVGPPPPSSMVKSVTTLNGMVWFLAENMLWRFNPATDHLVNVSERIGKHSQITGIAVQDGQLWMTLEFDGVWSVDAASLEVSRFTEKEGVVSPSMSAAVAGANQLVFGGGRDGKGLLNVVDAKSRTWRRIDLASPETASVIGSPGAQARRSSRTPKAFHLSGNWLAVETQMVWLLCNTANGQVSEMNDLLEKRFPRKNAKTGTPSAGGAPTFVPSHHVQSCAADSDGLWLALDWGQIGCAALHLFNPDHASQECWELPGSGIASMASDGEYLWILYPGASAAIAARVVVFHKPSHQWAACFEVPSLVQTIEATPVSIILTSRSAEQPLLEISKRTALSLPREKWVPAKPAPLIGPK